MQIRRYPNQKRGVTLAELSIVLALIAIVSTMIVSFSVMVRAYADRTAGYRQLQDSFTTYEEVFDFFVSAADTQEFYLTKQTDVKVKATVSGERSVITPVFSSASEYNSPSDYTVGEVLCAVRTDDLTGEIIAWLFLYDDTLYARFPSGTSTVLSCDDFSDLRYLLIEQSVEEGESSHPLVRSIVSYKLPSVAEEKEIATYDFLRATRVTKTYQQPGGGEP